MYWSVRKATQDKDVLIQLSANETVTASQIMTHYLLRNHSYHTFLHATDWINQANNNTYDLYWYKEKTTELVRHIQGNPVKQSKTMEKKDNIMDCDLIYCGHYFINILQSTNTPTMTNSFLAKLAHHGLVNEDAFHIARVTTDHQADDDTVT